MIQPEPPAIVRVYYVANALPNGVHEILEVTILSDTEQEYKTYKTLARGLSREHAVLLSNRLNEVSK